MDPITMAILAIAILLTFDVAALRLGAETSQVVDDSHIR